jgi:hypothetical protein
MSMRGIYFVGGSKSYGSGKVVTFLRDGLQEQGLLSGFIETQGAGLEVLRALWYLPRRARVLYQPSICFPAFVRDMLMVAVMRLRRVHITYFLMVDVAFKNPLLRSDFARDLFFGGSVVLGLANFSLPVSRSILIVPYYEPGVVNRLPAVLQDAPVTVVHLGYRSRMKGWVDLTAQLEREGCSLRVVAIGGTVTESEVKAAHPVELMPGASTSEIETSLCAIMPECFPVYIFLSREDFAPLMVLEAGHWGLPIATVRGSRAEGILERMLPQGCYVVLGSRLDELERRRPELLAASDAMGRYLITVTPDVLLREVVDCLDAQSSRR